MFNNMSINAHLNDNLRFCKDGHVTHNLFPVRNFFRKCSLCKSRKFRWRTKMIKCRECNLLCHGKCFSKLIAEEMNATTEVQPVHDAIPATEAPDAIPETADRQQVTVQQVQRLIYYVRTVPASVEPIDGYIIAIFLQQRLLKHIDYSELVARVRAAKYAQRPYPVVNFTDRKYILWGKEIHMISKFEMDDGDEYYVITICYNSWSNENRYIGKTIYVYSPSPLHETVRVLNRLWNRPHLVRIQSVIDSGYS
eukprot:XP_003241169.1 PREDICTED: uncharacterized protein LOC100570974 isoform X2 [Acyrthosiphon pisum]